MYAFVIAEILFLMTDRCMSCRSYRWYGCCFRKLKKIHC